MNAYWNEKACPTPALSTTSPRSSATPVTLSPRLDQVAVLSETLADNRRPGRRGSAGGAGGQRTRRCTRCRRTDNTMRRGCTPLTMPRPLPSCSLR